MSAHTCRLLRVNAASIPCDDCRCSGGHLELFCRKRNDGGEGGGGRDAHPAGTREIGVGYEQHPCRGGQESAAAEVPKAMRKGHAALRSSQRGSKVMGVRQKQALAPRKELSSTAAVQNRRRPPASAPPVRSDRADIGTKIAYTRYGSCGSEVKTILKETLASAMAPATWAPRTDGGAQTGNAPEKACRSRGDDATPGASSRSCAP